MGFENQGTEGLGEAYARDMEKEKEEDADGYNDLKEAYANDMDIETKNDPASLKEAYEKDMQIENGEGKEGSYENPTEIASFENVGREKWDSALEKVSTFSDNLAENGKKVIYTATGIAFELPGIAKETGKAAIETGKEVLSSAKESFVGAVDSAKEKVQEVKANLVEKAQEAKRSFFEKITRTKDKYVGKAAELTGRGIEWGIDAGERVAARVTETQESITNAVQEARARALKSKIEKGKDKLGRKMVRFDELMQKIGGEGEKVEIDASLMQKMSGEVNELSA